MNVVFTVLIGISLAVGIFFAGVGVLGVLKMPDFFSRIQASTCITTMGALGAIVAGVLYAIANGLPAVWYVKLAIVGVMLFVSSAVSGHALTKGTYKRGHRPHGDGFVKDDYEEDGFDED